MKEWTYRGITFQKWPDEGSYRSIWRAETAGAEFEIRRIGPERSYWFGTITVRVAGKKQRFHLQGVKTRAQAFDTAYAKLTRKIFRMHSELAELEVATIGVTQ